MAYELSTWYFEDIKVGDEFVTPSRTITEADVTNFAYLSGDYNRLHVDEEFAKKTQFKGRIAHGLLGLAVSSGLFTRTELNKRWQDSGLAFLGLTWKFLRPIMIGDTIAVKAKVKDKGETKKGDRGIVTIERKVYNQRGEVVQEGETQMMLKKRGG